MQMRPHQLEEMLRNDAAIDAVGCEDISERSHHEKKVHLRINEILMGKKTAKWSTELDDRRV